MTELGNKIRAMQADCNSRFSQLAIEADGGATAPPGTTPTPTPTPEPEPIPAPPGGGRVIRVAIDWNNPERVKPTDYGGMGPDDVLIVEVRTGGVSSGGSLPRLAVAEFGSSPSARIATLSLTPGDFTTQTAPGANIAGNSVTAIFALGTGTGFGYYPVMPLNTSIFLNVKNAPDCTCRNNGVCDVFVDLVKVGGL